MKTRNPDWPGRPACTVLIWVVAATLSACAANTPPVQPSGETVPTWHDAAAGHAENTVLTSSHHVQARQELPRTSFDQWVAAFRARALARGVAPATADAAFADLRFVPDILEMDGHQPEFSRRIWSYLDSLVSDARVRIGRRKLAAFADIIADVEQRYGVPGTVIGAIWGIESSYGANFGSYSTVSALATLAFEGRRRDWAVRQIYAIFDIIDRDLIEPQALRGSWAGAMGHTQFLPTSYLAYAVDGDEDGRIDIWASIADVMASTANYLVAHGWQSGSPWGVEVTLPQNFDYSQARLTVTHSARFWQRQGVGRSNGMALPSYDQASVLVPAGMHGPAFLVGPNFRVIMSYNHAISYALAVGLLADRLAGESGISAAWPRNLQPLSHDQILHLQRLLNRSGFDAGTPDGIIGPNTRAGVRAFQALHGWVADGFVTRRLLQRVRRATGLSE